MSCEHKFEWADPGGWNNLGQLKYACIKCGVTRESYDKETSLKIAKLKIEAKIGRAAIAYQKAFDLAERINQDSIECDYQNDETGSLHVSLAYNKSSCLAEELNQLIKIYEKEYPSD